MSPPRDVATVAVGAHTSRADVTALPIDRPRLLRRLQQATINPLTLVSAPAGFGKSTLLQQLRAAHPRAVRILPAMAPPPECACPAGTVVVIDEREPRTRPLSTDDIVELVSVLPEGTHVVASRRQPWTDDDVAAFGSQQIERFTGHDLTFTDTETATLLRQANVTVASADAITLSRRTGGWAAGLMSAVIAMRDVDDVITYIEVLGGDDRHVASYLRAEVMGHLAADELELLTRTAVVDRLDATLCAWVTADDTAAARLADLCRKGVIEASDDDTAYTCHPMLRDHLWRTLKETDAVTARICASRAALWHSDRGELDVALQLYVKGEAWNGLLRMVDRAGRQLLRAGLERQVAEALSHVPPAARGRHRAHLIDYAAFQTWGGDPQAAEDTLVRLTDHHSEPTEQALVNVLLASRVRLHGRAASAAHAADAALAAIESGDLGARRLAGVSAQDIEVFTRIMRATARWYDGDVAGARSDFEASVHQRTRVLQWELRAKGGLALLEATAGRLGRARELSLDVLSRAEDAALRQHSCSVEASLAMAHVDRERNVVNEAARRLGCVQEVTRAGRVSVPLALAMIEQARCDLARGNVHDGIETLRESRRDLAAVQSSRFTCLTDAVEAQLLLASGRAERAIKLLTSEHATHDSDAHATTMQAFLEQRQLDDSARCLEAWPPEVELRPQLQRRLWSAVLDHVTGSRRSATRAFAGLAAEAETEGFVRLFLDSGPLVARLLHDTLALQPSDYLQMLDDQWSTSQANARPQSGPNGVDVMQLLSQRELEVVRYLPTRLSAIEIAEHLYISYNTLKSHMRSIYRKFGVSSRQELIRRAEELGLA